MNKNIIYNLDFLHTSDDLIEDNSIDLVIIDPPYNIGVEKWDKIKDYVDWSKYYLDIIFKKMKNNSSLWIYGSANKNFEYLEILLYIKSKLSLVNWVIWCKNSGLKNVKNKFAPSHEDIVWFSKGNNIYIDIKDKEDFIIILVRDCGIGINKENLNFNRYPFQYKITYPIAISR